MQTRLFKWFKQSETALSCLIPELVWKKERWEEEGGQQNPAICSLRIPAPHLAFYLKRAGEWTVWTFDPPCPAPKS